eukprot:1130757-Amphidinium_carterae.1
MGGRVEDFVALARESYVVLRVGVEAHEGPSFPEELVVYPETDKSLLRSSAAKAGLLNIIAMAVCSTRHTHPHCTLGLAAS